MSLTTPSVLAEKAAYALDSAKQQGAEQAMVVLSEVLGDSVSWRNHQLENISRERNIGLSLIVYNEQREGSTSISDWENTAIEEAVRQALLASEYNEVDAYNGLPESKDYAADVDPLLSRLELVDEHALALPALERIAKEMEDAALEYDQRIVMSDGANVGHYRQQFFLATSNGFAQGYQGSRQTRSISVLAREAHSQQTQYDYDISRHLNDARAPHLVGEEASRKAVARLNPQKIKGGRYPVIFDASVAGSLFGHLLGGLGGRLQYRQLSFLNGALGQRVLPDWLSLCEQPHKPRALYSAPFDGEGLPTHDVDIIRQGEVQKYLLDVYSARRLGLPPTGNAGGVRNAVLDVPKAYIADQSALYRQMQRGVIITQLMGQGVNMLTGDYSRGASGFWVENGEIAYPIEGITIAGNLQEMFNNIVMVGEDIDYRGRLLLPSLLLSQMTVAQ